MSLLLTPISLIVPEVIIIVDYQMGNLGSIQNMLRKAGAETMISRDLRQIASAEALILPGVGRFDRAMEHLDQMKLRPALEEAVLDRKIPTLGICLGMQLMTDHSEEGDVDGLGWFRGRVKKFEPKPELKLPVPHMGWNDFVETQPDPLLNGLTADDTRFYFVHSYAVTLENPLEALALTDYGGRFVSVLGRENIRGVQFHPEKSHRFGLALLKNFVDELSRVTI